MCVQGAAHAQSGWTGSRLPDHITPGLASEGEPHSSKPKFIPAEARKTLDALAACTLHKSPRETIAFLRVFPDGPQAGRAGAALRLQECLLGVGGTASLHFAPTLLRGSFFRALYHRDFARSVPTLAQDMPPYRADAAGQSDATARPYVIARQFAECLVRKDTAVTHALLLAETGSVEETAHFRELQPDLGPCLVQGSTAQFNKSTLVGLIAEVQYRLSNPALLAGGGNS